MITLIPLSGLPMVKSGDDVCGLIGEALAAADMTLAHDDIVVVTQKIVSAARSLCSA